jgi:hypothetical protein
MYSSLCYNSLIPVWYQATVTTHKADAANPYVLSTLPTNYQLDPKDQIYCYNSFTLVACSGIDGSNCTCATKVQLLKAPTNCFSILIFLTSKLALKM